MTSPAPQRHHVSGLLIDMDGVLLFSSAVITRHWTTFAIRHGIDPAALLPRQHGHRTADVIAEYVHPDILDAEIARYDQHELDDTEGVVPTPGASELLDALGPHRWCVVTSASAPLARARLRAAGLPLPHHIVGADDVAQGKPHPEPYRTGLVRLGLSPHQALVVEDAPSGVAAGTAAGLDVIGLLTTHDRSQIAARYVVKDLSHV